MSRNFYVRTCVKFTFANKIEAIHKRSLVGVKVEVDVFRLVARIFLRVSAILRGDGANEAGGALRGKIGISEIALQTWTFLNFLELQIDFFGFFCKETTFFYNF